MSYDEFYNDAVNEEVDLIDDFKSWTGRSEGSTWTFASTPFVLAPARKQKFLALDANIQRRHSINATMAQVSSLSLFLSLYVYSLILKLGLLGRQQRFICRPTMEHVLTHTYLSIYMH